MPLGWRIVAVPLGASVLAEAVSFERSEISLAAAGILYSVMPAQPSLSKSERPEDVPFDSTSGIKVMNWNYPGHNGMRGMKYVDSQFREVNVGLQWPNPEGDWSYGNSIRSPATRIVGPKSFPENLRRPVVAMSGSADTLWRAKRLPTRGGSSS